MDVIKATFLALGADLHTLADTISVQDASAEGALDHLSIVGVERVSPTDDAAEGPIPTGLERTPG
jgi:hypothetical protein